MKRFAALFLALESTTRTSEKTAALAAYFREAPEQDRLWTIALLSGRRPKRAVTASRLAEWAAEAAGLPGWLFEESYAVTGDLAETIALILPPPRAPEPATLTGWITRIRGLALLPEPERRGAVLAAWAALDGAERFLFNKLITGGFRMGVAQGLMTRALAQATGIAEPELALRLMGDWTPDSTTFSALVLTGDPGADLTRPYPFCLAHALEQQPEALGAPSDWAADWKWDGIRGQAVLRGGRFSLWSRGEELVTDRFPELAELGDRLPGGTVIDGEILAFSVEGGGAPLPFAALQRRIGRKTVSRKLLAEVPVILMAYDLLEEGGRDVRAEPLAARLAALRRLVEGMPASAPLRLSAPLAFADWAELTALRAGAAAAGAEGVMIKRLASAYHVGRRRGDWWKWKLDPMTFDAVMVYAQAGHGRRANLYTDFTFALWQGDALVPVTKAYSGLTDSEFAEISAWVRRNTLERFGPVRRVAPDLVFEIAFEGIRESPRHKSGIALRFPRMLRWRRDKPASEADTLEAAQALLKARR